jgi:poly(A) polymerase
MSDTIIEHRLPSSQISSEALTVVARLQRAGYKAYFVGGCVRDLLIERSPKDFDIATDARPEEVKSLFGPACRLIGRRFRLAHVRVGQSLLEVATFRGRPDSQQVSEDESGFVVRANTFGNPEDDAHSRDFTMNGLFYDPLGQIIYDYVGGMQDIRDRKVRAIGPVGERLREDPVRILRAIRLGTRLGFDFTAELREASAEHAKLVRNCSKPRVVEELFRIFETGYSAPSWERMVEFDLAGWLIPQLDKHCRKHLASYVDWLAELDRLTLAHGPLPRATVFCFVAWPLAFEAVMKPEGPKHWDWGRTLQDCINTAAAEYAIPIRYRERLRATLNIVGGQWFVPPLPAHRTRSPALPIALAIMRAQFRLGIGNEQGYEALCHRSLELGFPEAPFDPPEQDNRGRQGAGRSKKRDGRGRRRQRRRRVTATQM